MSRTLVFIVYIVLYLFLYVAYMAILVSPISLIPSIPQIIVRTDRVDGGIVVRARKQMRRFQTDTSDHDHLPICDGCFFFCFLLCVLTMK